MTFFIRRTLRYTLVSIGCALLHNVVLIVMDASGASVIGCQVASAAILLPVGFILQSRITFASERSWRGFFRYAAALLTNFPVVLAVLWLARDQAGLSMWMAAPISSVVLFCWNYMTSTWALAPRAKGLPAHV
ncbi:GtrA family protein [Sphingomonas sp. Tas61C01]|uniref:GtrA family protein n=1 Tax=Sphingomonas sp. Tas61C01 TaxID=3458297 RepID=UPI00403E6C3D